jgi:hypothetical protein
VDFLKPHKLIFTDNIPTPGESIEVLYSSDVWSSDDIHPKGGYNIMGEAVINYLAFAVPESLAKNTFRR